MDDVDTLGVLVKPFGERFKRSRAYTDCDSGELSKESARGISTAEWSLIHSVYCQLAVFTASLIRTRGAAVKNELDER